MDIFKNIFENLLSSREKLFLATLKKKVQATETKSENSKKYSIVDLFTSGKALAMTSGIIAFVFIAIVMAYYGLSFGAADLPGDVYVNNVINGAVEVRVLPNYWS